PRRCPFFHQRSGHPRELHPFPTRRSSDLAGLDLPAPHLSLRTFVEGALHPGWGWHFLTSETISFPNIGPPDRRSRDKIKDMFDGDRKSTRLNSSHLGISYAVFCLKKNKNI